MEQPGTHNPYSNWKSGLVFETLVLLAAIACGVGVSLLAWFVAS